MNHVNQSDTRYDIAADDAPAASGGGTDLYQWHLLMRGRYLIAGVLAAVLGASGAVGGYLMGKKDFQSTAIIQVTPTIPRVLYENEERTLNRYEQFVDTQIAIITGRRVVESAMREAVWRQTGVEATDQAIIDFGKSLSVSRRNDLLQINFRSDKPEIAVAGAQAVLNAYKKVAGESEAMSGQRRTEVLQSLQQSLTSELQGKRQRITSLAGELGSTELLRQYELKVQDVQRLEMQMRELASAVPSTMPTADGAALTPLSAEDWAETDGMMARLLAERDAKQAQLSVVREKYGAVSPIRQAAEREVQQAETAVAARATRLEARRQGGGVTAGSAEAEARAALLESTRATLTEQREELHRLGRLNSQIADIKADMELTQQNLEDTRRRIEQLRVEAMAGGRITPMGEADRPLETFRDTRVRFAGAGGLGGMILGVGLVLAYALLDDRVRHSRQAGKGAEMPPVIGLLPNVGEGSEMPEQSGEVARALHLIRASLQLSAKARGKAQVLTVTGPLPGSGKTSLTLGLGTSFGRSGSRTLLVDFDPIGRGLSHAINVRTARRLGSLLLERGVVSAAQLERALGHAQLQGIKIGQALVDLRMVERRIVDEELKKQAETTAGVTDALRGESILACTVKTPYENVWLMPSGDMSQNAIGTTSPKAMAKLVERMSEHFDTVLFDTGPMPGCVESALAAAASDQAVVVLSRGDSRKSVHRTVTSLRQVGAQCAGLIYNRAEMGDYFEQSSSMSMQRSRPVVGLHRALLANES